MSSNTSAYTLGNKFGDARFSQIDRDLFWQFTVGDETIRWVGYSDWRFVNEVSIADNWRIRAIGDKHYALDIGTGEVCAPRVWG